MRNKNTVRPPPFAHALFVFLGCPNSIVSVLFEPLSKALTIYPEVSGDGALVLAVLSIPANHLEHVYATAYDDCRFFGDIFAKRERIFTKLCVSSVARQNIIACADTTNASRAAERGRLDDTNLNRSKKLRGGGYTGGGALTVLYGTLKGFFRENSVASG